MANGETLDEVRKLLESEKTLTQPVVNRLILSMLSEVYDAQKSAAKNEDVRHEKIDNDLTKLKKKSIVIWVEENKPVATLLFFLLFIVFLFAQSILVPAIARALGVPI